MSISLGSWIHTVVADAQAAAKAVVSFFDKAANVADAAAPAAEAVAAVVDPSIVPMIALSKTLIDAAHAAVTTAGDAVAQGGVNIQLDTSVVAQIKALEKDMVSWLTTAGLKPADGGGPGAGSGGGPH